MIIIYIFTFLLLSIKSRIYNTIDEIYYNLSKTIHKIPIQFAINGTNDYSYNFQSQDILYYFSRMYVSEAKKELDILHQHIKIIFDLNISENNNELFNYFTDEIKYHETISADIYFKSLKFYEIYDDFSFDFQYEIDDLDKDIIINYENIDKLNLFNYLLFEEKNDLYENNTLNHFIKINIINTFEKQIKKYLITFPECDSLEYFKSIIHYFKNQLFLIDYKIINPNEGEWRTVYQCKINEFKYKEITKKNRSIIFNDINVTAYFVIDSMDPSDFDNEREEDETKSFQIDYISINNNKKISYGKLSKYGDGYELESLKLIINKTISTLENKEIE